MPPQVSELEILLGQLVAEHRRLLAHVERHAEAMKKIDLPVMEDSGRQQEACRLRINAMEQRRRLLVQQISRAANQPGELTLPLLAGMFPAKAASLLKLRAELKAVAEQIAHRTRVAGTVAAAAAWEADAPATPRASTTRWKTSFAPRANQWPSEISSMLSAPPAIAARATISAESSIKPSSRTNASPPPNAGCIS